MKPPKVTVCLCYNLHWLPVSSLFAASLVSASGFPIPSACSAPWDVWGWPLPLSESTMKICRPVFISSFWVVTVTLRETWPWLQSCVARGLPPYGPGAELAGQCQPLSLAWRQGPRLCVLILLSCTKEDQLRHPWFVSCQKSCFDSCTTQAPISKEVALFLRSCAVWCGLWRSQYSKYTSPHTRISWVIFLAMKIICRGMEAFKDALPESQAGRTNSLVCICIKESNISKLGC